MEVIMNRLARFAFCVIVALVLTGCPRQPSMEERAAADYGNYPYDYEEIVKQHMRHSLFDPYSAQYEFLSSPTARFLARAFGGKISYGYGGYVFINAKNRYGAYVGNKKFKYLIRNGAVIYFEEALWE
jgi:hypothetical protein